MANKSISQLTPSGSDLTATDLLPVVQTAGTGPVKMTGTQIKTGIVGPGSVSVASGKTFTASNTLTLAGTDSTTMTFPPASASVGYLNIPQNSQTINYTTVLADSGKHVIMNGTSLTLTIDSNANVPYATGTAITIVNANSSNLTISITSDTLTLAGTTTTGSRTLGQNGIATVIKIGTTSWLITGTGLS